MRKKSSLLILFFIISVSPYLNAQDALLIKREDAIDDIKEMFRLIEDAHYNPYLYLEQEKFNTKKDSLIKIILLQKKEIRKNDFLLHCMQFLANLNDAHTSMKWWNAIPQENWEKAIFFEMELTLNENGHIYSSDRKQIVKINDHEIEMLFNEAMKCYGGNYIFRKNFVEKTFFSAYLHLRGIQPPFKILYSTGETEIIDKKIKLDNLISRFTPQNNDYKFELKDNKVGIIYYNNCVNIKSFKKFLKSTFKEIQQNNIDKLIIDIRQNTGGNSALNDLLLSYLTTKEYRQSSTRYWKVSKTQQDFFASNKKIYGNRMVNFFMNQPINSIVKEDEFSPEKPKKNKLLFNANNRVANW